MHIRSFVQIYPLTWLLLLFHTVFVITVYEPLYGYSWHKTYILAIGLVSIVMQVQLVKLLSFGNRKISALLTSALLSIYAVLYGFHYNQHVPMDYTLLYENFSLIFYKESVVSIISMVSFKHLIFALSIFFLIYMANRKFSIISSVADSSRYYKWIVALSVLVNITLLSLPKENTNTIFEFVKSVEHFYQDGDIEVGGETYPYININEISNRFSSQEERPHVFLLFMESYNGLFTDKVAKNGKVVTPYFNELKKQGYYVENFYGHSIQTSKGQFGTLSGVLPGVYSKVFTTYPNLNLYALPQILADSGYETVFTKAYKSLEFDNTRSYAKKLGFKHIESMGIKRYRTQEDRGKVWGWGLQDDRYYHKFFNYLDDIHKGSKDRPIFASLTTVSNHMMFNKIPENQKYIYPYSKSNYENFINSLHLADRYLETFFKELHKREYLKNSIVIVTGDHSWPSGNHGYWHNETSFYEEFFKIPFLIIWDGVIEPEVSEITASQIDIAPTILDMLQIQKENHLIGKSLFVKNKDETIFLVQPYNGTYIVAQNSKIKYVKHQKTEKEYLFDLLVDPKESRNLILDSRYEEVLDKLRSESKMLLVNNQLIRENRLWPASSVGSSTKIDASIEPNFTLTITQQDRAIRSIDSKHFDSYKVTYNINTIDFLNEYELVHTSLGKLSFFNNYFTTIEGAFTVTKDGYYDIYVASDDGFRLFIDEARLAQFAKTRKMYGKTYNIYLSKGKHHMRLEHFQGYGKVGLQMAHKAATEEMYQLFGVDTDEIKFGE